MDGRAIHTPANRGTSVNPKPIELTTVSVAVRFTANGDVVTATDTPLFDAQLGGLQNRKRAPFIVAV